MADPVLKINPKAIAAIAKGAAAAAAAQAAADKVASAARDLAAAEGLVGADRLDEAVVVDTYTTDRAVAAVGVFAETQATDGLLSRAASAAGLSISGG